MVAHKPTHNKLTVSSLPASSQAVHAGVAGRGNIGSYWINLAAAVSEEPEFKECGGVKPDNCQRHFKGLLAAFKEKKKNGQYTSGTRTGEDEEVVHALSTYAEEEEEMQRTRDGKLAEDEEITPRREKCAQKVNVTLLKDACS